MKRLQAADRIGQFDRRANASNTNKLAGKKMPGLRTVKMLQLAAEHIKPQRSRMQHRRCRRASTPALALAAATGARREEEEKEEEEQEEGEPARRLLLRSTLARCAAAEKRCDALAAQLARCCWCAAVRAAQAAARPAKDSA